jgi:hypothetical protein
MLDANAACARLLAHLASDREYAIVSCLLSADARYFILAYNTKDYVQTGDIHHALVGPGPCLVDRVTGAVETFGTAVNAETLLQDRQDAAEAGARRWVLRPARPVTPAAIIATRRWLDCSPALARALQVGGPWFWGSRREVEDTMAQLRAIGIAVEAALIDDLDPLPPLPWGNGTADGLRAALRASAAPGPSPTPGK